ncbi:DegT/DnrJ/EryC1/StrS family aminotransferase [Paenibacillus nasutitermitis]|uniref:8-amino-3,8-dideoxy-alpha-D-manno-octulosonate transaminase n=1 Tax=Paenibacillus nasutitermitis TaxID=1652958 RepID=A0A917DWL9_9BACL|nr:DegT/DnrJ/EryC1/StrS family aminotransferase [Paenibacillus nasutitermitis]GGD78425.1 8-amino-3,8-dideoxy-alpha-D-manno-octulosonate transaminase [Paenibacillus nasutitermitis]
MKKLAMHGGIPARTEPLPPNYPGAVVMGAEEAEHAARVIHSQSPFRFYGADVQNTVQSLEMMMADKLGVAYALGVTSCTAALVVALKALGIGYGDKVIIPAVTFLATAGAVISSNAVPVFVDVDESLNLDPNDLERVMDKDVKAVIAVSILGNPCDMDGVMAFAAKHHIHVIEDVAQSCGVKYKDRYAGTIGDIGVYSFQMNKIITAGEGGAIVTRNSDLFERAVRYHDQGLLRPAFKELYGMEASEEASAFVGQNYRMSEITGAVLVEQWKKLDPLLHNMRQISERIRKQLAAEIPSMVFRKSADYEGDIGSNIGFQLRSAADADLLLQASAAENITMYRLYGGKPVYMLPQILFQRTAERNNFPFDYPFANPVVYSEHMCPRAEDLLNRTVFMPISPILTEQDEAEIIGGIHKIYSTLGF